MSDLSREERLAAAFVELADTLVKDFDVIAFLHQLTEHCVDLLDVRAAGVVLALPHGPVVDVAASDENARRLELAGVEWDEGPCHDCYRSGTAVAEERLDNALAQVRWPRFAPRARQAGFTSVVAAPLQLRGQVIGALNLFRDQMHPLAPAGLRLGQALADTATIGILHQWAAHEHLSVIAQLQQALDSRVIIEQAKGALANRRRIDVEEAFHLMRRYARNRRAPLTAVALQVLDGSAERTLLDPGTSAST
ncbi:GAF and ANTAR domain-containing protein [Streptomyces durmitorensis]|uniref:GAF and ANTAR domain-containing protein n=1 Tax=Streptomyces durmitorensis TaxID=319947 RepID=A0ABY4Q3I4_9ACTN|nr:GAF and ANTAR domain-containing protein [Streptomyces durmitorensis]UQT60743.1 GAF and ANTAR domain-containing protein [Streptomyces durmitorensis]